MVFFCSEMKTFLFFQLLITFVLIWFSDYLQHYLVISGFSWITGALLHYLLLLGNLVVLIFTPVIGGKIVQFARILVSIVNLSVTVFLLNSYQTATEFISYQLFVVSWAALTLLVVLSLFKFKFINKPGLLQRPLLKFVGSILTIGVCVAITLLVRKPFYEDYVELPKSDVSAELDLKRTIDTFLSDENWNPEKGVITFVTTSCPHCKRVASQLETARISGSFTETFLVVGGKPTNAANFIESTGYTGPYSNTLNDTAFFEITKGSVPKIFHFNDGSFDNIWNGNNFNYIALDYLSKP
jgi:glutaredoxin